MPSKTQDKVVQIQSIQPRLQFFVWQFGRL
jgi:hypothetical protein